MTIPWNIIAISVSKLLLSWNEDCCVSDIGNEKIAYQVRIPLKTCIINMKGLHIYFDQNQSIEFDYHVVSTIYLAFDAIL